jgi:hypothetical protein
LPVFSYKEHGLVEHRIGLDERERMRKRMSTQTKIALGSVLSTFGALAFVLSLLLVWTEAPSPWALLLGFFVGVITGLGTTLAIAGLVERRRANQRKIGA